MICHWPNCAVLVPPFFSLLEQSVTLAGTFITLMQQTRPVPLLYIAGGLRLVMQSTPLKREPKWTKRSRQPEPEPVSGPDDDDDDDAERLLGAAVIDAKNTVLNNNKAK